MSLLIEIVGKVLDEKYRIDKQLGQGGMGAVYLATHLGTQRPVALKVISPQFMTHPEFVERFKREAEAAGRLRHPNVVDVTDFGFTQLGNDRLAYLVMEFLDGCNLGEVLKEEEQLPLAWVIDILEQVCLAVEKAHQQGIIHRDLKPDNIWLEPNERGGYTVKVLDFGLAKLAAPASIRNPIGLSSPLPAGATSAALSSGASSGSGNKNSGANSPAVSMVTAVQMPSGAANNAVNSAADQGTEFSEQATNIQPSLPAKPAAPIADDDEGETAVIPARATDPGGGQVVETSAGLTQAGAVLGTPIYMSPEQCAGETLSTRTDIYSIGVIAYEMLTGAPPFDGNMYTLMAKHMSVPPPSLKEKRPQLPTAVADLVMSTLAKDPSERPVSAAAFASALRARSEGTSAVLRQVFALTSEHFRTFFYISLIAYAPCLVFNLTFSIGSLIMKLMPGWSSLSGLLSAIFILVTLGMVFAQAVNAGVIVPLAAQLLIAPLRPVQTRPAFDGIKKRLRILIPLSLPFSALQMLIIFVVSMSMALILIITIPGVYNSPTKLLKFLTALLIIDTIGAISVWLITNYYMFAPVAIMEGLKGRQALKRAKTLAKKVRRNLFHILAFHFGVLVAHTAGMVIISRYLQETSPFVSAGLHIIISLLAMLVNIVINPLQILALAVVYFKARQIDGEILKDILGTYEQEVLPASNWQMKARERLRQDIQTSRSTGSY